MEKTVYNTGILCYDTEVNKDTITQISEHSGQILVNGEKKKIEVSHYDDNRKEKRDHCRVWQNTKRYGIT